MRERYSFFKKKMKKQIIFIVTAGILCIVFSCFGWRVKQKNDAGDVIAAEIITEASSDTVSDNTVSGDTAPDNMVSNVLDGGFFPGGQLPEAEAAFPLEIPEEEENEYSDLAIAQVDRYVNVRNAPDTNSEILGKIYNGAVAHVLGTAGENGDWFQVVSGNVEGFIKSEFFVYGDAAAGVIDQYVTRYAQVRAERLNVRKEADISSERIGYVNFEEKMEILEDCGEWIRVRYMEEEGYVSAEYVTVLEEFTYAKSIAEEQEELALLRELEERKQKAEAEAFEEKAIMPAAGQERPVTSGSASDLRAAIVDDAMQYLGNAYVHGGGSLAGGTDCSGFTCFIYADFGYSISRTPAGQLSGAGRSIDYSEIQPGDIICYSSNGKTCTHVGLYIGDGQIIHAANARKGVIISAADYSTIVGVKNVID